MSEAAKTKPVAKRFTKDTPKAARPPRSIEDRLKRLFVSLTAQIDGGHFKNAIKTCNKILILAPNDPDVLQTKLFLLLQTDEYAAALALAAAPEHGFQKAYALYRLNREVDAANVVKELKETDLDEDVARGIEHLEAQMQYRTGDYDQAVKTYTHLLDTCAPQSDEQADLLTNLSAAQAHLDFFTSGFQASIAELPSTVTATLETAPAPTAVQSAHIASAAVTSMSAPAPRRAGPRPSRVPKGVIPGVTPPPDPERWLKKSERTNVVSTHNTRKKGKKVVGAAGTTQGAAVVEQPQAQSGGGGGKKKKR